MRKARTTLIATLFVAAFTLFLPLIGSAQNREKFVISARAGGVNAVTGRATMKPQGNSEWRLLTIKEDLETGDAVRTGVDGRVELLLNPGSYLRIGEESEFELADSSLENLEVRLIKGTAILEVTGADDQDLYIGITTPHTRMSIIRRGLYRVNVVPGDVTELIVRKGRVVLEGSHTKVKGGNKVVFSSGSFSVAKLEGADKKDADNFAVWSKDRAETLAKANSKIPGRALTTLTASFRNDWLYPGLRGGSGFWLFSPGARCYTFIPYSADYLSPYGGGYYYRSLWSSGGCWECRRVWLAPGFDTRGYAIPGYPASTTPIGSGPGVGSSPSASPSRGPVMVHDAPMRTYGKPDLSPGGPAMKRPNEQ